VSFLTCGALILSGILLAILMLPSKPQQFDSDRT
jgi:hypothetical protein